MAKASSPIVPPDFPLDLGFVAIPAHAIRDLAAVDASGSGIILSDAAIKFRLTRDDGEPVEYTVSVAVKRTPLDTTEVARVQVAKQLQAAKKAKRDEDAANERRSIAERARMDGVNEGQKEMAGFRSGVESAAKILPVLSAIRHTAE